MHSGITAESVNNRVALCGLLLGALLLGVTRARATEEGAQLPPMVEWVEPAVPTNSPQTPAQEEQGRSHGRTLPTPEFLQPTLDPSLPVFHPCQRISLRGTFNGASSDVLPGLVTAWIERFKRYCPKVRLSIAPPFAGSLGAQELIKQNLDFVFVSRELKPDDIDEFKRKFGYAPASVPVSGGSYRHFGFLDAVGFFVNKDNPLERISFQQLDAILSTTHYRGGGPITVWGQLGLTGEWADKPIHVYAVKPWNGFEEFVRQRVLSTAGQRGEWRTDLSFDRLIFPIAAHVAQDRYALGYTGLAFVDAGVKSLALAPDANGAFFFPSYENVAQAAYPLTRLIYFNFNQAPGKALDPALAEFLHFILGREGQQLVLDQAVYLPLREGQASRARALID